MQLNATQEPGEPRHRPQCFQCEHRASTCTKCQFASPTQHFRECPTWWRRTRDVEHAVGRVYGRSRGGHNDRTAFGDLLAPPCLPPPSLFLCCLVSGEVLTRNSNQNTGDAVDTPPSQRVTRNLRAYLWWAAEVSKPTSPTPPARRCHATASKSARHAQSC